MPVEEAQARLLALAAPLDAMTVPLAGALGRYLAQPLTALRTQPEAPISAMDGYAIRFADLPGPWRLSAAGAAGSVPTIPVGPGEAARIFTGAMLPEGSDTVVIQEEARCDGRIVTLTGDGPAATGQHVRRAGGDFSAGDALASPGTAVSPGVIALAAMGGHAALAVGGLPRVAIMTTGDELVAPGAPLSVGQIPDSNSMMLAALIAGWPAVPGKQQRIGDDRDTTAATLAALAADHDVIVTVGGASVGDHDHVRAALTSLDAPPAFWKVAMRPGKPVLAARLGDAVVLGLPGNPASAFVTAHLFVFPLLRHLAGATVPLPPVNYARLATDLPAGGTRRDYLRAVLSDGQLTPYSAQDSGFVRALATANALIIRDIAAPAARAGTLAAYLAI